MDYIFRKKKKKPTLGEFFSFFGKMRIFLENLALLALLLFSPSKFKGNRRVKT